MPGQLSYPALSKFVGAYERKFQKFFLSTAKPVPIQGLPYGSFAGFFFLNNINKFHIQLIIIELQLCCRQHARYNYKHLFSQPQNKLCEDGHVICLTLPSTSFSCLPYLVSKSYWITHQNMSESDHSLSLPLLL